MIRVCGTLLPYINLVEEIDFSIDYSHRIFYACASDSVGQIINYKIILSAYLPMSQFAHVVNNVLTCPAYLGVKFAHLGQNYFVCNVIELRQ